MHPDEPSPPDWGSSGRGEPAEHLPQGLPEPTELPPPEPLEPAEPPLPGPPEPVEPSPPGPPVATEPSPPGLTEPTPPLPPPAIEPAMIPPPAPPEGPVIYVLMARAVQAESAELPPLAYAKPATFPDERKTIPWWLALIEAILLLPVVLAGAVAAGPFLLAWGPADERWATVFMSAAGGVFASVICAGALWLEGSSLASVGWKVRDSAENLLDVVIGFAAYVLTIGGLLALAVVLSRLFPEISAHESDAAKAIKETFPSMSPAEAAAFMLFVAVWEEFAFRGFLLTRLRIVFKRWWLAVPAGALMFGLGHGYEGGLGMVQTMLLGLVLGTLFVWRKSLVPCVVFHFMNNFVAFLLLRMVAQ